MICKTFELRDCGTFIPVLAIKLRPECEADWYLLSQGGYGTDPKVQESYVLMTENLNLLSAGGGGIAYDPYSWPSTPRTYREAHKFIKRNFDALSSGAVIDVEHILGESTAPKESERVAALRAGD
jgi:hypothetical protein